MTPMVLMAMLATGAAASKTPETQGEPPRGVCVALCNHWSYIGIGWQLGIESCVLSAEDAMELADRDPHIRTCLNLDARAYEFMAEKYPEVADRLKKYLRSGKVELIGGTYGQPMGTTVLGESNIRQVVYGRQLIKRVLGYDMATFLEEEEFSHPQLPQILVGAGFKYASLAQVDTWGIAGIPTVDLNTLRWKGLDGSTIPTTPKNALFRSSLDLNQVSKTDGFKKLSAMGKPLIMTWEEFGWEPHEDPAYLHTPGAYKAATKDYPVEYVTLKGYMDKYGAQPKDAVFLNMDAFNKRLTWGLGGDQIRVYDRKNEGLLLAAETFDAIASALGRPTQAKTLEQAWNDHLAAQSHDVGLCEYSRWQGWDSARFAPLDRVEDKHNFTWGAIGYDHMDAAHAAGQRVLDASLRAIASKVAPPPAKGDRVLTVFNPTAWERSEVVTTGKLYPLPAGTRDIQVVDGRGQGVASQIVKAEKDAKGNLSFADVAFFAAKTPGVGYATYSLRFLKTAPRRAETDLGVNVKDMTIENRHVKIRLDRLTGAIVSVFDKQAGREMLRPEDGGFPTLRGKPCANFPLHRNIPASLDSSKNQAHLEWTQLGPLVATLRARHQWPTTTFETLVTLRADSHAPEVVSRLLTGVPPERDGNLNDYQEGYWLTFAPAREPASVVRDYPLGVESTQQKGFHALTFADLASKDGGLLVLHNGTQWFQTEPNGTIKNLIVREWESYYSNEWGFPRYVEYRHALMPHGAAFGNADRLRASSEFCRPLLVVVGKPGQGTLPLSHSFLAVTPASAELMAFRRKVGGGYELRFVESEGTAATATATLSLPVKTARETDLLGRVVAPATLGPKGLQFKLAPWRVATFDLK